MPDLSTWPEGMEFGCNTRKLMQLRTLDSRKKSEEKKRVFPCLATCTEPSAKYIGSQPTCECQSSETDGTAVIGAVPGPLSGRGESCQWTIPTAMCQSKNEVSDRGCVLPSIDRVESFDCKMGKRHSTPGRYTRTIGTEVTSSTKCTPVCLQSTPMIGENVKSYAWGGKIPKCKCNKKGKCKMKIKGKCKPV